MDESTPLLRYRRDHGSPSSLSSAPDEGEPRNYNRIEHSGSPSSFYREAVALVERAITAKDANGELPIVMRLPSADLPAFKKYLEGKGVSRFCYEFATEECYLEMKQSVTHTCAILGVRSLVIEAKLTSRDHLDAPKNTDLDKKSKKALKTVAKRLDAVRSRGAVPLEIEKVWEGEPDLSFSQLNDLLPAFVAEIAFSQTTDSVERKAWKYFEHAVVARFRVRAVLIVDIAYPDAAKATVSLLAVGDDSEEPYWAAYRQLFYDETVEVQPAGEIDVFASDFLADLEGVPSELIRDRPHATAVATAATAERPGLGRSTIAFESLRHVVKQLQRDIRAAEAADRAKLLLSSS